MNTTQNTRLSLRNLEKTFSQGGRRLTIFKDLNLDIQPGEIIALVGQSGSGKSTLLHIAGLLDAPTAGHVIIGGAPAEHLHDRARTALRRNHIGFIYQFHHLLPEFTALENVAMPLIVNGKKQRLAHEKAAHLLESMGLSDRLDHRPARLSGGEQQRVAIARALANDPKILLADEPTGNLDPETSANVFDLLLNYARAYGLAVLIATHNHTLAAQTDKAWELSKGHLLQFKS